MNWTRDKPWKTGFYWYRESPTQPGGVALPPTVVEVVISEESFVAKIGEDGDQNLEAFTGEWMGPLEVPQ